MKDKCSFCGETNSEDYYDYNDKTCLCDDCHLYLGKLWHSKKEEPFDKSKEHCGICLKKISSFDKVVDKDLNDEDIVLCGKCSSKLDAYKEFKKNTKEKLDFKKKSENTNDESDDLKKIDKMSLNELKEELNYLENESIFLDRYGMVSFAVIISMIFGIVIFGLIAVKIHRKIRIKKVKARIAELRYK